MAAFGMQAQAEGGDAFAPPGYGPSASAAMLGAVREDVRQTLRVGWIDPVLEAASGFPLFFTAAWSAIRPNVGKSFLALARVVRTEAVDSLGASVAVPDIRRRLERELSEEELIRIGESARALHQVMAKVQIVTHAMHRMARRERIPGTGREEPPVRRGVPEWQRWMSFQPSPPPADHLLGESGRLMGIPSAPTPLRLFARWPSVLMSMWQEVTPLLTTEVWHTTGTRLRRIVLSRINSLPHPMELQWGALMARGFNEPDRERLSLTLAGYEASMASQTAMAAFAWIALGSPEMGLEG